MVVVFLQPSNDHEKQKYTAVISEKNNKLESSCRKYAMDINSQDNFVFLNCQLGCCQRKLSS